MQLKIAQTKRKTNKTLFQVRIARFKDRIKEIIYCTRECNVGAQKISSFVLLWIACIFIFKNELRKKRHHSIYLCNRSSVCTAFMKFRLIHRSIKYLINSGCVIYSKWIPIEMKCVFNLQLAGDYLNWIICDQIMNYCQLLAQLSWHQTCRGATEGELNEWGMLLNLWLIKITRWHELNQNRHTLTGHKNNRVSSMVGIQSEQNIV